jgi:hypothetical protein
MDEQAPKVIKKTIGIDLPEDDLTILRAWGRADERPIGYYVRAAVKDFIAKRKAEEAAKKKSEQ